MHLIVLKALKITHILIWFISSHMKKITMTRVTISQNPHNKSAVPLYWVGSGLVEPYSKENDKNSRKMKYTAVWRLSNKKVCLHINSTMNSKPMKILWNNSLQIHRFFTGYSWLNQWHFHGLSAMKKTWKIPWKTCENFHIHDPWNIE